jgi:CubicO group peptidase (beta-lactamase class C family)
MTKDSMFRIYSMTKPITGVAMMQLYEKGLWQMDDPVSKHVPELAGLKVLSWKDGKVEMKGGKPVLVAASAEPTMRQLMSHTAGFAYGLSGDDPANNAFRDTAVLASANLEEMIAKIKDIPLIYDPGSRWYYSVAVDIQGYIVQKLSGQKLGEYMKANIFTPLGMNDTSFYVTEANVPRFADVYRWDKDAKALLKNE